MSDESIRAGERGLRTRREILGAEESDRASASVTAFTAPFQEFVNAYAWGEIWSRPGLDRRSRSMVTLALLTALRSHELEPHIRIAVRNGLTREEIGEVLLHTAVYAGVPAANSAFGVAQCVFDELDDACGASEPTLNDKLSSRPGR
jgi:4-carboxymuconolactone decarboxylase